MQEFVHGPQVTVVPDGEVALVPFAALIDGDGRYVAESLQVRLVPSLATAKMIMEQADEPHTVESRPLIVGDPDVVEVKVGEETEVVKRLPFAGACAVLVSLWAVADEATMYFMKSFYEHLIRGETASEALSQAMRAMRETEEYSHPRHWGGFVLIGDNVAPFGE